MNMMRESLAQTRAALAGVAGMLGLAKRVWTGAKSATEGALCRSDLTRPFEVLDSTMVAGSPGRRVAGSPGRRVAGSPGRRVAGSPILRPRDGHEVRRRKAALPSPASLPA